MTPSAHTPYASSAANFIYNLLFGEPREALRAKPDEPPTDWQRVLFTEPPDLEGLKALAANGSQEGRTRYLAFARLREARVAVPPKILLGVVVEVGLDSGLDALAAYADGAVRYVNHSGTVAVAEDVDDLRPLVERLFQAAAPVVARIGPWTEARRPPPARGNLRLSFLVSDGLYFGEGPIAALQRDAMAGPVFSAAAQLLQQITAMKGTGS